MLHTLIALSLAPLVQGPPTDIQPPPPEEGFSLSNELFGPAHEQMYFGHAAVGDFDSSLLPSVVVQVGDEAQIMWNPGTKIARTVAHTGVIDLDVLPASNGHPDRIAVLDGAGLHLVEVVESAGPHSHPDFIDLEFQTTQLIQAVVDPGSLLRVADMNFDGLPDIITYDVTTNAITLHLQLGDGTFFLWAMTGATLFPVLDLEAYDGNGDGVFRELGLMSNNGLEVIDLLGNNIIKVDGLGFVSDCITKVAESATGREWLAHVRTQGNVQRLYKAEATTCFAVCDMPLDSRTLQVTAGDLNNDGYDDLALNMLGNHAVGRLYRQFGSPNEFDGALVECHRLPGHSTLSTTSNPFNNSSPVMADLDRDGDLDLCVGFEKASDNPARVKGYHIWRNDEVDGSTMRPTYAPNSSGSGFEPLVLTKYDISPGTTLTTTFAAPAVVPSHPGTPYMELTFWEQPDVPSPVEATPIGAAQYLAIDSEVSSYEFVTDLGYSGPSGQRLWFFTCRVVWIDDTTNTILSVGPSTNSAFAPIEPYEGSEAEEQQLPDPFLQIIELLTAYSTSGSGQEVFPLKWVELDLGAPSGQASQGGGSGDDGGVPVECTGDHPEDIPPRGNPPATPGG